VAAPIQSNFCCVSPNLLFWVATDLLWEGGSRWQDLYAKHLQVAVVAVVAAALDFLFLNARIDGAVLEALDIVFLTDLAPLAVLTELAAVVLLAALLGDLALLVLVGQIQAALIDLLPAVVPAEDVLVLVAVVSSSAVAVVPAVSAGLMAAVIPVMSAGSVVAVEIAVQLVVDLALLAVVALGEMGALVLESAGPPLVSRVLHVVLDNASASGIVEFAVNFAAALAGDLPFVMLIPGGDHALIIIGEQVVDDVLRVESLIIVIVASTAATAVSVSASLTAPALLVPAASATLLGLLIIVASKEAGQPAAVAPVVVIAVAAIHTVVAVVAVVNLDFAGLGDLNVDVRGGNGRSRQGGEDERVTHVCFCSLEGFCCERFC